MRTNVRLMFVLKIMGAAHSSQAGKMNVAPPWSHLQEDAHEPLRGFLRSVKKRKELTPQAILVYGSAARGEFLPGHSNVNLLILLELLTQPVLQAWAGLCQPWNSEKIVAPLFLTQEDLRQSSDVFPLEFLNIKEHHVLLQGRDPFAELPINTTRLFLQCEQELRGNLLRIRQRYVEGCGRVEAVQALLPLSLTALIPCLRGVYRLLGRPSIVKSDAVLRELTVALNLDPTVFLEVWQMKRGLSTPGKHELPRLLDRYLVGLSQLADRIESMKHEAEFQ